MNDTPPTIKVRTIDPSRYYRVARDPASAWVIECPYCDQRIRVDDVPRPDGFIPGPIHCHHCGETSIVRITTERGL